MIDGDDNWNSRIWKSPVSSPISTYQATISYFYRPVALPTAQPNNQQCQSTEGISQHRNHANNFKMPRTNKVLVSGMQRRQLVTNSTCQYDVAKWSKTSVEETSGELGVSKSAKSDTFPSVLRHCWLGDKTQLQMSPPGL